MPARQPARMLGAQGLLPCRSIMIADLRAELVECRTGGHTFLRSVFALILREARVRHGRSRLGYAWAVAEPFAVTAAMIYFFTATGLRDRGLDFAAFYASGLVAFAYFRHASGFIGLALEANTPLFSYPRVRELDAAVARLTLDTITSAMICALVFAFLYLFFNSPPPHDLGRMIVAYFGLGLLAFGVGLNIAALQRRFTMTSHVYNMLMAPAFVLSGVIFSLQALPYELRSFIVWNPIIHGVESFRSGYLPGYPTYHVDVPYLYFVGLILTATGMVQIILSKRGMR